MFLALRQKLETQVISETVSAQLPEIGESWNIQWMFLALRQKLETQERPGDIFTPR